MSTHTRSRLRRTDHPTLSRDERAQLVGLCPPPPSPPELSFSAWPSIGPMTSRHSRTAFGLPGRLMTSVLPRVPATARESQASGCRRAVSSASPRRCRRLAVDHRAGRLGRDVARREAGAAGGQDEVRLLGERDDRGSDLVVLVGHEPLGHDLDADAVEDLRHRRRRRVDARARRTAVADRQDRRGRMNPSSIRAWTLPCDSSQACASTRAPAPCR